MVMIFGEITTTASVNYEQVIREAEIQCKTTGLPDEAIARRLCQRLAQAGPAARQRR